MEKVLEVPFLCQHDYKYREEGRVICSLYCLAMVYAFFNKEKLDIETLTKELDFLEGYNPAYGSTYTPLMSIYRNRGLAVYYQEYKSHAIDTEEKRGSANPVFEERLSKVFLNKVCRKIDEGIPTVVSVLKKFRIKKKFHQVVLVGYKKEGGKVLGFYFNDPGNKNGKSVFVDIEKFKESFHQRAIFFDK